MTIGVTIPQERFNTAMASLLAAFEDFRREASGASDPAVRKAALEDAAEVGAAIGAIENGLNRGKYDADHLEAIARGEG